MMLKRGVKLPFTGSCLGNPIAWILADVFLIPAFFLVQRRLRNMKEGGIKEA